MSVPWTPQQQDAIRIVDRSVQVSAAAGSGKTAVLAARCVHLLCDAPPPWRCDADGLLVVTFTEAAATEMRARIHGMLSDRLREAPEDRRLRMQLALLDAAQISTIHAFCRWMVRRWFNRVDVDAGVQVLDADEADLLREETLTRLFEDRFAGADPEATAFRALVDDYGIGHDREITTFVRELAGFLATLPDPDGWITRTHAPDTKDVLTALRRQFRRELSRQADYCAACADRMAERWPAAEFYRKRIADYAEALSGWRETLDSVDWDTTRAAMADYKMLATGPPNRKKLDPQAIEQLDQGKALFTRIRDRLFKTRLDHYLRRFRESELREGLSRTRPFVTTLANLAMNFNHAFTRAKQRMGVVDFNDLERLAYQLLTAVETDETPSTAATELRERFAHVLVDEFQDVNPLQAALLRTVSREGDQDVAGNFFTVGDVKQSIYRFRLAEPTVFLERSASLESADTAGKLIPLSTNFRSQARLIRGVNAVFRSLMREEVGGIPYDDDAELIAAKDAHEGPPIEVHLLPRVIDDGGPDEDEDGKDAPGMERYVDAADPLHWQSVQREAYLIGERIQALRVADNSPAYGEICILLRSARHAASVIADVLGRMGIPAFTEKQANLFDRREVRETLSLLQLIDNAQQDIPLASCLRSGILGEILDENELAAIRIAAPASDVPYHRAVRRYARLGPDDHLRRKLRRLRHRFATYRQRMRAHSTADVLWMILHETGYLASVSAMRDGDERRRNLLALHERARQFSQFRRQGLRRFLRFVEHLQRAEKPLGTPPAAGSTADAVRIMSIHQAKGLEFPVVFVTDAGRRFNLQDTHGKFLLDRAAGIGLKVVDPGRMIEYPSALHAVCRTGVEEASLAEELRVWYVALTRARERLIVVGTTTEETAMTRVDQPATGHPLHPITLLSARDPLTWLLAAAGNGAPGQVAWNTAISEATLLSVYTVPAARIATWRMPGRADEGTPDTLARVAQAEPLPPAEPQGDGAAAARLVSRINRVYPHRAVAAVAATRSASARDPVATEAQVRAGSDPATARLRGTATHAVLEHLDLACAGSAEALARELDALVASGCLAPEDRDVVDVAALAWFFASPLGERIRQAGDCYHREWMFLAREPVSAFDATMDAPDAEEVLVRGVVDGVLAEKEHLEVLDFKTDQVSAGAVEARAATYRGQLRHYAFAAEACWRQPVRACHLVFLHPQRIVTWAGNAS